MNDPSCLLLEIKNIYNLINIIIYAINKVVPYISFFSVMEDFVIFNSFSVHPVGGAEDSPTGGSEPGGQG